MAVIPFKKKPKVLRKAGVPESSAKSNRHAKAGVNDDINQPPSLPARAQALPTWPQDSSDTQMSASPPPPYTSPTTFHDPRLLSQSISSLDISAQPNSQQYSDHIPFSYAPQATKPNPNSQQRTAGYMNQGAALCDIISSRMNTILTAIDGEEFGGREEELFITHASPAAPFDPIPLPIIHPRQLSSLPQPALPRSNYFAKVWYYSNSRLPPSLPPLKLYMPTYPLLCLAAQYSLRAYTRPNPSSSASIISSSTQATQYVDANWRLGTKAMVLKTHSVDERNCIVFAIRGSQTFMDWAVNFRQAPSSPVDFLDDPGNLVHSGFLQVAKAMVGPVAARLRSLLQDNPARAGASLLITGHSAGGAVASLLYIHMLSQSSSVNSDLKTLTGFFKRVHCVTFGAPPVSLLPLQRPQNPSLRKSLFLGFLNEGDPVVRADNAFVRSLISLYTSPIPSPAQRPPPTWPVPQNQLSNAGRLVVLRAVRKPSNRPARRARSSADEPQEHIEACITTDEQLRRVVFGDPLMHMMRLYARRIESLAVAAVTAGVYGDSR